MSKTFDEGKADVAKLCQYFATNRERFLAPGVKEAHIRQNLIDPLFEALRGDVRNATRRPGDATPVVLWFDPNGVSLRSGRLEQPKQNANH